MNPAPGIYLGIDGGATHSYAIAVDHGGRVRACARAGSLNFLSADLATSRRTLASLRDQIRRALPRGTGFRRTVIGCAALSTDATPVEKRKLCAGLLPLRSTRVVSDAQTAYFGATLGRPGVVVIAGTGSVVLARGDRGVFAQTGGWGHLLGDEGGAWWIAREAVRAALAAAENRGPTSRLAAEVRRFFRARSSDEVVAAFHAPENTKDRLAALAGDLASRLSTRDTVWRGILQGAGKELAAQALAAIHGAALVTRPVPVYLVGSVLSRNRQVRLAVLGALRSVLPVRLGHPQLPPVFGAVALSLGAEAAALPPSLAAQLRREARDDFSASAKLQFETAPPPAADLELLAAPSQKI